MYETTDVATDDPGSRFDFTYWAIDTQTVYFFGGNTPTGTTFFFLSVFSIGYSADVWKLDAASNLDIQWTFMSGEGINTNAVYGPIGTFYMETFQLC